MKLVNPFLKQSLWVENINQVICHISEKCQYFKQIINAHVTAIASKYELLFYAIKNTCLNKLPQLSGPWCCPRFSVKSHSVQSMSLDCTDQAFDQQGDLLVLLQKTFKWCSKHFCVSQSLILGKKKGTLAIQWKLKGKLKDYNI